jgi:tetratricopeptide (TPR) repeat protein
MKQQKKMKMELKSTVFGLALLFLTTFSAFSQCKEVKWPEDRAKAEEAVAIYGDALKQGNYRGATASLRWMLNNAPQWQTKLYIDGIEIYNKLAAEEKDPVKKQVLVDSLMLMYELRIANCGDQINVLNRKVQYNLLYNGQNKDKTASVLAEFDKVFEISGNNVSDNNLEAYMKAIQLNVLLLKSPNEDQILQRYDKITEIIDAKIKKAQSENKQADVDRLKKIKASIDDILIRLVKVDCDFVRKNLAPKFKQNPNDQVLVKKIFQFMTTGGCIDDPLWLQAAEEIHKTNPDYGLAKNMAKVYAKNENMSKAEALASQAASLASTPQDKAEAHILHGDLLAQQGDKSGARESYRKAIAADANNKEGYEKIGDLYLGSYKDCAKQKSFAEDRLVYIAAFEMYAKAGNQNKMATAKAQFPSVAEIFELNWKEGETKKLECWVGETVVLRTRGKE